MPGSAAYHQVQLPPPPQTKPEKPRTTSKGAQWLHHLPKPRSGDVVAAVFRVRLVGEM